MLKDLKCFLHEMNIVTNHIIPEMFVFLLDTYSRADLSNSTSESVTIN